MRGGEMAGGGGKEEEAGLLVPGKKKKNGDNVRHPGLQESQSAGFEGFQLLYKELLQGVCALAE